MATSGLNHLLERYTVALEADPENPKLRVEVAEILEELGRSGDAVEQYATAARFYVNLGLFQEAAATCDRVVAIDRDHVEANRILAGLRRRGLVDQTPAPEASLPPTAPSAVQGAVMTSAPPEDGWSSSPFDGEQLAVEEIAPGVDEHRQQIVVLDASSGYADATIERQMPPEDAPRPSAPVSTAELMVDVPGSGAAAPAPSMPGGGFDMSDDDMEEFSVNLEGLDEPSVIEASAPSVPGAPAVGSLGGHEGGARGSKLDPRRPSGGRRGGSRRRSRRSPYDATVATGSGTHAPTSDGHGSSPDLSQAANETGETVAPSEAEPTGTAAAVARAVDAGHVRVETTPLTGTTGERGGSGAASSASSGGLKPTSTAASRGLDPHLGLFERLPPNIAAAGLQQTYTAGQALARQGERCDSLLLLTEGRISLSCKGPDGESVEIGEMPAGAFVGELGLLGAGEHLVTIRAAEDCTVLAIPRKQAKALMKDDREINRLVRGAFRDRIQLLVLKTSKLFATLHERVARRLLKSFRPQRHKRGALVVKEGEQAPGLFLVLVGKLSVRASGPSGEPVKLAQLQHGDFFGEISLLRDRPTCADVVADGFVQLLHLAPAEFRSFADPRPSFKAGLDKVARERERANKGKI